MAVNLSPSPDSIASQPLSVASVAVQHFQSLDLLRGVAALMIVLIHAFSIVAKAARLRGEAFTPVPVAWFSCLDLFFVMSGFLMIHTGYRLYGAPGGVKNFALRRLLHTPPLYWLYTLFIAALFLARPALSAEGPIDARLILSSLFFFPLDRNPVVSIGWTLNYEMFFYLLVGVSLLLPFAKGWKALVAALLLCVAAGRFFDLRDAPWSVWTDPMLLDFALGVLIAVAYRRGFRVGPATALLLFCASLGLILCEPQLLKDDPLRLATMGLGTASLVAASVLPRTPLHFGKLYPVFKALSQQSYMMYLCHILTLKILQLVYFHFLHGLWAERVFIMIGVSLTLCVARVLYLSLEIPLSAALRQQAKRRGWLESG